MAGGIRQEYLDRLIEVGIKHYMSGRKVANRVSAEAGLPNYILHNAFRPQSTFWTLVERTARERGLIK